MNYFSPLVLGWALHCAPSFLLLYTRACLHTIYSSILHLPPFAQGSACPPTCSYLTTPLSAVNFAFHSLVLTLALKTVPPQVPILTSHWHRYHPSLLLSIAPEFSPQSSRLFPTSAAVFFPSHPLTFPTLQLGTCLKQGFFFFSKN